MTKASGIQELLETVRYMLKAQSVPPKLRHEFAGLLNRIEGDTPSATPSPNDSDEEDQSIRDL